MYLPIAADGRLPEFSQILVWVTLGARLAVIGHPAHGPLLEESGLCVKAVGLLPGGNELDTSPDLGKLRRANRIDVIHAFGRGQGN